MVNDTTWNQLRAEVTDAVLTRDGLRGLFMQDFDDHVRVAIWAADEDESGEVSAFTSDLSTRLVEKFGEIVLCRSFHRSEDWSIKDWVPLAWNAPDEAVQHDPRKRENGNAPAKPGRPLAARSCRARVIAVHTR